jgi:hypothetical protein
MIENCKRGGRDMENIDLFSPQGTTVKCLAPYATKSLYHFGTNINV